MGIGKKIIVELFIPKSNYLNTLYPIVSNKHLLIVYLFIGLLLML